MACALRLSALANVPAFSCERQREAEGRPAALVSCNALLGGHASPLAISPVQFFSNDAAKDDFDGFLAFLNEGSQGIVDARLVVPATGRPNLGETRAFRRGALSPFERVLRRALRRSPVQNKQASDWKAEKYRRGERVSVDASPFLGGS